MTILYEFIFSNEIYLEIQNGRHYLIRVYWKWTEWTDILF